MSPIYPKGAPESRVLMFHELGRQAASHVFSSELSRRCFLFWSDYCHTTCPRKQPLGGPASSLATGPPMAAVFFGGGRGSTRQICRRPSESLVLVGVWFVGTTRRASQEASTQKKGHKESRDDKLLFLLLSSAEIMTLCIYLENTCCGLDHDDTKTPFFSTGLLPQYRQMTKSSLVYLDCGC